MRKHGVLRPAEEYARFRADIANRLAARRDSEGEAALREAAFAESEAVLGPVA